MSGKLEKYDFIIVLLLFLIGARSSFYFKDTTFLNLSFLAVFIFIFSIKNYRNIFFIAYIVIAYFIRKIGMSILYRIYKLYEYKFYTESIEYKQLYMSFEARIIFSLYAFPVIAMIIFMIFKKINKKSILKREEAKALG